MRRSSPRALSSPRARSRRRANTSGEREGSWAPLMRNAECGVRNCPVELRFRIPNSALRIGYAAATAPAAMRNSRRRIVLAPPESAAYITRPPRRLEGGFPMQFEARIEPLTGKLPKVSYRWDPETDILSVACKGTGKTTGLNGTVDLEGGDGSFVVIDVAGGCIHGVDVVTWPDVRRWGRGGGEEGGGGGEVGGGEGRLGEANRGVMTLHAPEWSQLFPRAPYFGAHGTVRKASRLA